MYTTIGWYNYLYIGIVRERRDISTFTRHFIAVGLFHNLRTLVDDFTEITRPHNDGTKCHTLNRNQTGNKTFKKEIVQMIIKRPLSLRPILAQYQYVKVVSISGGMGYLPYLLMLRMEYSYAWVCAFHDDYLQWPTPSQKITHVNILWCHYIFYGYAVLSEKCNILHDRIFTTMGYTCPGIVYDR